MPTARTETEPATEPAAETLFQSRRNYSAHGRKVVQGEVLALADVLGRQELVRTRKIPLWRNDFACELAPEQVATLVSCQKCQCRFLSAVSLAAHADVSHLLAPSETPAKPATAKPTASQLLSDAEAEVKAANAAARAAGREWDEALAAIRRFESATDSSEWDRAEHARLNLRLVEANVAVSRAQQREHDASQRRRLAYAGRDSRSWHMASSGG